MLLTLSHCRGHNALYETGLISKLFWFLGGVGWGEAVHGQLYFQIVPKPKQFGTFWPQNGPCCRSCHLRGQKSLGPLEKSRFCAGTI